MRREVAPSVALAVAVVLSYLLRTQTLGRGYPLLSSFMLTCLNNEHCTVPFQKLEDRRLKTMRERTRIEGEKSCFVFVSKSKERLKEFCHFLAFGEWIGHKNAS